MVDKMAVVSNTLIAKVQEIAQKAGIAGERREPLTLSPEGSVALAEFLVEALDAQAWFWTEEWQAGERAVDEYLAAGDTEEFSTAEEFLLHASL
ncbi:MAG TPA: AbrB family transcriptional regulator [Anaerolineae bacterium]|nr:AbrB family transcriptional regulator [Anaerolineae bacterium]